MQFENSSQTDKTKQNMGNTFRIYDISFDNHPVCMDSERR